MVRIIGYTADADYWCPDHAREVYGEDTPERKDREGNDVHPIFSHDERPTDEDNDPYDEVCNACLAEVVYARAMSGELADMPTLRD